MKTKIIWREVAIWIIILAPVVFYLLYKNQLPDRVPSHYGFNGEPNDYQSPGALVALVTGIMAMANLLLLFLPRLDPKRYNYVHFGGFITVLRFFLTFMFSTILISTFLNALGYQIPMVRLVIILVYVLYIILGNYFGKVRPNWFVGIRTPWTMSSETVWRRTHFLAGRLLFIMACIGLVLCFIEPHWAGIFVFVTIAVGLIFPMIMSYIWYRQEKSHK